MEAQAVEQPHPLAELAVSGLGWGPQLQVEGATCAELDLELPAAFVVDEELDELQGEQPGREEGATSGADPPWLDSLRVPGAYRVGAAHPSAPLSSQKEAFFTFSAFRLLSTPKAPLCLPLVLLFFFF